MGWTPSRRRRRCSRVWPAGARAGQPPRGPRPPGAMLALEHGDLEAAERLAIAGAGHDPGRHPAVAGPGPRAGLDGRPGRGQQAAEAASVKQPGAGALRVLWAEARLEAGQPEAAADVLQAVLARTTTAPVARLLLVEAVIGLGREPDSQLERALALTCSADAENSPVLQAACAVQAGSRARLLGDRAAALRHALAEAADSRAREPRTMARAAQLAGGARRDRPRRAAGRTSQPNRSPLDAGAGLGSACDRAWPWRECRADRAATGPSRDASARGPRRPGCWRPPGACARPWRRTRRSIGIPTCARWRGWQVMANQLTSHRGRHRIPRSGPTSMACGPGWPGNLPRAAQLLGRALSGHGGACRAAGEYLAVVRLLRRVPGPDWTPCGGQPQVHQLDAAPAARPGPAPARPSARSLKSPTGVSRLTCAYSLCETARSLRRSPPESTQ